MATALDLDPLFGPIRRGAAAVLGRLVNWHGAPVTDPARTNVYRRGHDAACIPAGGSAQVLCDYDDGPLQGHFWRAKTGCTSPSRSGWVRMLLESVDCPTGKT